LKIIGLVPEEARPAVCAVAGPGRDGCRHRAGGNFGSGLHEAASVQISSHFALYA
jgi:hypothetical protein